MSDFETNQSPRIIPTSRPAKAAFDWFNRGFRLFEGFKVQWVVFTLIIYVMVAGLSLIPVLGELMVSLLLPGFFVVASVVKQQNKFDPMQMLEPVKRHLKPLLHLFIINYLAAMVASFIASKVAGVQGIDAASGQPEQVFQFLGILFVIYIPVLMGVAFAPALIIFDKLNALDAFKMSFSGCFKNALSLTVFTVILLFAFLVALIPFGLGLLLLLPVMHCTTFAMYEDIFRHKARFSLPDEPTDDEDQNGSFMV